MPGGRGGQRDHRLHDPDRSGALLRRYDLLEVQTSANVMEEALWRRIPSLVAPAEVPRALGLVSSLFSAAGKDALARTYVSLAAGAKAPDDEDASGG